MILNQDQEMIRSIARRFASERLAPHAAHRDVNAEFPVNDIAEMGRLGLMGITIAPEYDGSGADHVSLALALEAIAGGDAGVATVMSGHNSVGCMPVYRFGTPEQKEAFLKPMARGDLLSAFLLTEPQGGSDASNLKTVARRTDTGYVLNGTKQFVTSGSTAKIALIFAATDPKAGAKGITGFLVPTDIPGYLVVRKEDKLGQRSSDTCQIALENVEIPENMRLGAEGQGYSIALSNLEGGRIGIAALAVGIAQAALDAAIAYARERITFGKPIFEHQAVQFRLSNMAMSVESARQLVLHAAQMRDAGLPCLKEACMAKMLASETAEQVCSDAIQTL
ncbi:MAG: acyl-CoA dehydrogenase family protein, partial [Fimbriimonadaceae bacterium]|nr:acyl-CoA dehydrogenase family protein [Alphaproteobacteria bacterium]